MPLGARHFHAFCLLALSCSFATLPPARAQFNLSGIGPSKGQVVGAVVGAGAALTGIGLGVYFATRAPRITGCLLSSNGGLELQGASPDQLFLLTGQTGGLAAGQRVKVVGKKLKASSGQRTFLVRSLLKNYGACTPAAKTASLSPLVSQPLTPAASM